MVIGTRNSGMTDSTREKQTLVIRRLRCKECGKIHHELPCIIILYKRHCAETCEKIIAGDTDGVPRKQHNPADQGMVDGKPVVLYKHTGIAAGEIRDSISEASGAEGNHPSGRKRPFMEAYPIGVYERMKN